MAGVIDTGTEIKRTVSVVRTMAIRVTIVLSGSPGIKPLSILMRVITGLHTVGLKGFQEANIIPINLRLLQREKLNLICSLDANQITIG